MESQFYILSELKYQLDGVEAFGELNESNDVICNILDSSPGHKEDFLRAYWKAFVDNLSPLTGSLTLYQIKELIRVLSVFWSDAKHNLCLNSDETGVDGQHINTVRTVYYSEVLNYVAPVYYSYLSCPQTVYFHFWESFPGLDRRSLHQILIDSGLSDEKHILELEASMNAQNHPLQAPPEAICKNPIHATKAGPNWESVSRLESFVRNTIDNLRHRQQIYKTDWKHIDGKNKEDFVGLIVYLREDCSASNYRQLLTIVDKVARLYNGFCLETRFGNNTEPETSIRSRCIDLLESYLGVILLYNQTSKPNYCLFRMIKMLDISIDRSWLYLMDKMAEFNDEGKELNYLLQSSQCSKCDVRKCRGRFHDIAGKAKYVGAEGATVIRTEKRPVSDTIAGGANKKESIIDTQVPKQIDSIPELKQAIIDKKIDASGLLLVEQSKFVLYCNDNGFFSPWRSYLNWLPIDNLLTSKKGKKVTARMLAQSYQDLARVGKV